jgi:hypothetical protein
MPRPDRDVYILKVGDQYRVRPAVAPVEGQVGGGSRKKIHFRNATKETVTVVFEDGVGDSSDSLKIDPGKESKFDLKDLPAGTTAPKVVRYMVVVSTPSGPVTATGESEPVIIIDP